MGLNFLDVSLAVLGLYVVKKLFERPLPARLPPGPKGYPVIGNLLDVPSGRQWLGWSDHKALYGTPGTI